MCDPVSDIDDISKYLVSPDINIREVIEVIDQSAAQIALVVDKNQRLRTQTTYL